MRVKQDKYVSTSFSHPGQSGVSYATYYITHNRGKKPDLVILEDLSGLSGLNTVLGFDSGGAGTYYGAEYDASSTTNSVTLDIYRMYTGSTTTLRAKLIWF